MLHNTLFIEPVAQKPDVDAAICRSWNRWLADVWAGGQGRLRWSCVLPTLMLDEAVVQMRFAKEHGAVAVCVRPLRETGPCWTRISIRSTRRPAG